MTRIGLVFVLTLLLLILPSCKSDDDGGSPTGLPPDAGLQDMAACAREGLMHIGFAIETALILFHELDRDVGYDYPYGWGSKVVADTLKFNYARTLTPGGQYETVIKGWALPLETIEDGLQQGDSFTVYWRMRLGGTPDWFSEGTFRVNHRGSSGIPHETEFMRITPADVITFGEEGGCALTVTQLDLIVYHLWAGLETRSAIVGFTCNDGDASTNGLLTATSASNIANISGMFEGERYSCTLSLDTYAIDCAPD